MAVLRAHFPLKTIIWEYFSTTENECRGEKKVFRGAGARGLADAPYRYS
jgi:hypothetical protein